jgi:hypothetical protein
MTHEPVSQPGESKAAADTRETDAPPAAGWAGVAQVLLSALGGAAKFAVIVAGLLIALYFFIDQQNKIFSEAAKARQQAEENNEKKLEASDKRLQTSQTQLQNAQSQLLATYHEFQDIGARQVNNLKSVLDLRETVDTQTQQLENRLHKDEEELTVHRADAQKLTEQLNQKTTELIQNNNSSWPKPLN